jgi:hypothetical protein
MEIVVKGMCWGHYRRELRGKPFVPLTRPAGRPHASAIRHTCRRPTRHEKRMALFEWWLREERVSPEPTTGCLLWTGEGFATGYGALGNYSDPWGRYAHRAALYFSGVELPRGRKFHVRHVCDNPGCVAVAHLRLGTALENSQDRDAKGRGWHQQPEFREFMERRVWGQGKRTICRRGHPCGYTTTKSGLRYCKACDAERHRIARNRKAA